MNDDPRGLGIRLGRVVRFRPNATAQEFPAIINRVVDAVTVNLTVLCDTTPWGTYLAANIKHESEVRQDENPRWWIRDPVTGGFPQ